MPLAGFVMARVDQSTTEKSTIVLFCPSHWVVMSECHVEKKHGRSFLGELCLGGGPMVLAVLAFLGLLGWCFPYIYLYVFLYVFFRLVRYKSMG